MPTNKKNKFNRTKTPTGEKPPLGYFPIKQFRFKTENHPVLTCNDRCSSSQEAKWSQQEIMMILGLANTLQCDEREAIRIAIYETDLAEKEYLTAHSAAAKAGSSQKGHESRNISKRFQMTAVEKKSLKEKAAILGIRETEMIRLCVIQLSRGIRDGSIKHLSKSPMIGQMELFREWSRTHEVTESRLKLLKAAADQAWIDADELAFEGYEENKRQKKIRKLHRAENQGVPSETVDAIISIQESDAFEEIVLKHVIEEKLNGLEEHIFRLMLACDLTEEEALSIYRDELEEKVGVNGKEDLGKIATEWMNLIREEDINYRLNERLKGQNSGLSAAELAVARELVEAEIEKERQENTVRMNQAMAKYLRRRTRRLDPHSHDNMRVREVFEKNIKSH